MLHFNYIVVFISLLANTMFLVNQRIVFVTVVLMDHLKLIKGYQHFY